MRLMAYLPLGVLYVFADMMYFLMAYVIRYRRRVIMRNLRNAFPEKPEDELHRIRMDFYRHLADVVAETVKLLTLKDKEILRRCRFEGGGRALMETYYDQGKSFIGLLGHTGNWEWVPPVTTVSLPFSVIPAYRPLRDRVMDSLVLKLRGRYTFEMVQKNQVGRAMVRYRNMDKPFILGLIADQSPRPSGAYTVRFLNQDTLFFPGPEKLARSFRMPVFFVALRRIRRGYYDFHTELLTDDPASMPEVALSQLFMTKLEEEIRRAPAHWLWSHRRWKHSERK